MFDLFSFLPRPNKDGEVSSAGFLADMFKQFGNSGQSLGGKSRNQFGGAGEMLNKLMGGFIAPFAQFFQQLSGTFQSPEFRAGMRDYDVDIDFKEELLKEVPEGFKEPFLNARSHLSKGLRKSLDSKVERLLANPSLTTFEKRARFRSIMLEDIINNDKEVVPPEIAEALENACLVDFGVNSEADIDSLADNLVELSTIKGSDKAEMTPLQRVQAGNYDKVIARLEKSKREHELKIERIRDDIIARMKRENPDHAFDEYELTLYANAWISHAKEGADKPAGFPGEHIFNFEGIEQIDGLLRGRGQGLGLASLSESLKHISSNLEQFKGARARNEEFFSPEKLEMQGRTHSLLRTVKLHRAHKKIASDMADIEDKRRGLLARAEDLERNGSEEALAYKAKYDLQIQELTVQLSRKQRYLELLEGHIAALEAITTELEYQEEKQRFDGIDEEGADELRASIKKISKRAEAELILDEARKVSADKDGAGRVVSKSMMTRLGQLEESLSSGKMIRSRRDELRTSVRRVEHELERTTEPGLREGLESSLDEQRQMLDAEEKRFAAFQRDNKGASHVFETMREKDRVAREAIEKKAGQVSSILEKIVERREAIDKTLTDSRAATAGIDPVYLRDKKAELEAIFNQDGDGTQTGTLVDAMNGFYAAESSEKTETVRLKEEISRREQEMTSIRERLSVRGISEAESTRLSARFQQLSTRVGACKKEIADLRQETDRVRSIYEEQVESYKALRGIVNLSSEQEKANTAYEAEKDFIAGKMVELNRLQGEVRDGGTPSENVGRLNTMNRLIRELTPKLESYRLKVDTLVESERALLDGQLKHQGVTPGMSLEEILNVPQRATPSLK